MYENSEPMLEILHSNCTCLLMTCHANPAGSVFRSVVFAQKIAIFTDITLERSWNVCTEIVDSIKTHPISKKLASFSKKYAMQYENVCFLRFAVQNLRFDYLQFEEKGTPCSIFPTTIPYIYKICVM